MGNSMALDEMLDRSMADPAFREACERNAVADAFSVWLVAYRAQHGLSQRALAQRVGVKQPVIARLESGDVEPKLSTLLRFAQVLGTPVDLQLDGASVSLTVQIRQAA